MSLKILMVPAFVVIFSIMAFSQNIDLQKEQRVEELVESLSDSEESTSESSLLLDDLSQFADHPLKINVSDEDGLARLNLLNFRQIQEIMVYRKKYGSFLTIHELGVLKSFPEEFMAKIEPYISFETGSDTIARQKERARQFLITRVKRTFPSAVGFMPSKGKPPVYPGSPNAWYSRYRGEIGKNFEMGFTAENDAGETMFKGSNKYSMDFLSGFLSLKGRGIFQKIIVGDYHLRFGQGLSLWSGGGVSYASDLSSLMKSGEGIRPYSSSDENQFFRGTAIQLSLKPIKLALFLSANKCDANLESDTLGNRYLTSFRTDGLHRTSLEIEDEKVLTNSLYGGYAEVRLKFIKMGLLTSFQRLGAPVSKGESLYKQKNFEGDTNFNLGFDYQLIFGQCYLFGEAGISKSLKPAFIQGLIWKVHPQFSLSFLYRNYHPSFQSFYSGAFSAGSGIRNEEGFYVAVEYFPLNKLKIRAQSDLFYFPWTTFQTISPAQGVSQAIQIDYTINPEMTVYLHSKLSRKPQKIAGSEVMQEQLDESSIKYRLHYDWKISNLFQIRSRIEHVRYLYGDQKENGWLIFQDLILAPSPKLKTWIRLALYHTDGYNSRVYAYENDLLNYFAIPEFHGSGYRTYLNLKWQPWQCLALYVKAGYTMRQDATSLGSGNDATDGNHRIDVRAQVALKF